MLWNLIEISSLSCGPKAGLRKPGGARCLQGRRITAILTICWVTRPLTCYDREVLCLCLTQGFEMYIAAVAWGWWSGPSCCLYVCIGERIVKYVCLCQRDERVNLLTFFHSEQLLIREGDGDRGWAWLVLGLALSCHTKDLKSHIAMHFVAYYSWVHAVSLFVLKMLNKLSVVRPDLFLPFPECAVDEHDVELFWVVFLEIFHPRTSHWVFSKNVELFRSISSAS